MEKSTRGLKIPVFRVRGTCIIYVICLYVTSASWADGERNSPSSKPTEAGIKVTGLPLIVADRDVGFGLGVGLIFTDVDGIAEPYRAQTGLLAFQTTRGLQAYEIFQDRLGFLGTSLRSHVTFGYYRELNAQYFGRGNNHDIQAENRIVNGDDPILMNLPPPVRGSAPADQLPLAAEPTVRADTQNKFYNYEMALPLLVFSLEDWLFNSAFKWQAGVRASSHSINSYNNAKDVGDRLPNQPTLIDLERPKGYEAVYENRRLAAIVFSLAYDTRPKAREVDPNTGIFADIHCENYSARTGSQYDFRTITLTWRQYLEAFPDFFHAMGKELVLAYRLQYHESSGDSPFFEAGDIRTMAEDSTGLGGSTGLRGYKAYQFVDKVMAQANTEVRFKFGHRPWLDGMDFVMLLYYDVGRVAAERSMLVLRDLHQAVGGGIRIVWQDNTVISLSYGRSRYDMNYNLAFRHMF